MVQKSLMRTLTHELKSERMSEQKSTQRSTRTTPAVWSEQMSEQGKGTIERTSKWPSTYVSILVCSRPQCTGCQ